MTINNELFTRRPLDFEIPNDGVTNVDRPDDSNQWKVLEYELTSFVCEGEYEHGLQRILDSYIRHRGSTTQPAAWVSGFYGSGKSHLVRVLQHLWADTSFPNGASGRGLTNLPKGIREPTGRALDNRQARWRRPLGGRGRARAQRRQSERSLPLHRAWLRQPAHASRAGASRAVACR